MLGGFAHSTAVDHLSWNGGALTGPYALAPGAVSFMVLAPNGATPTLGDLTSHRYHHHTRIAVHGARVWVAFSSSGTNEDAGGQMVVGASSADGGETWSAPVVIVPPQSTWSGTGTSGNSADRVAWPRGFVFSDSNLYITAAIQTGSTANGLALVAALCNDDGTVGPLFRISTVPSSYAPLSGVDAIPYDAVLGPKLLPEASLYGMWGGSIPGGHANDWIGWIGQAGESFTEPTTVQLDSAGLYLERLWRKTTNDMSRLWASFSSDGGTSWTGLSATDIPNSPSTAAAIRLSDGRFALVGNPRDLTTYRDPLYLALFSGQTGQLTKIYAVRQGLSAAPVYAGNGKAGGAAYPDIFQDGGTLWVSYSLQKESIGVTRIPLAVLQ